MLSMESMIAISSRWGGGGRQTFPALLSRKNGFPHQCVHWLEMTRKTFKFCHCEGAPRPWQSVIPYPAPRPVCNRPWAFTNILNK